MNLYTFLGIVIGCAFTYAIVVQTTVRSCLRGAVASFLYTNVRMEDEDDEGWVETGTMLQIFTTSHVYDILADLTVDGFIEKKLEEPVGARAEARAGHKIASYRWKVGA